MSEVVPINPGKLPEGKEIGVICQTLAQAATGLLNIANAYAATNEPSLRDISKVLYTATQHVAECVNFMGQNINSIAEKYAVKEPVPQPPAA